MANYTVKVLQTGGAKRDPYTIAIVNNPAYELNGRIKIDPINAAPEIFEQSVAYIFDCLFGRLPRQAEKFLTEPAIYEKIRVISVWFEGLSAKKKNSLVILRPDRWEFRARQEIFNDFFTRFNLNPDVVFAVTNYSAEIYKASGFRTLDDTDRGGVDFEYDGQRGKHYFRHEQPGAVAIHAAHRSLTALHEFGHAASSYPQGYVADLYNNDRDENFIINKKFGNVIPAVFCTYNGVTYLSNSKRHENAEETYHAELIDTRFPALMDDYPNVSTGVPEQCQHDKLTRQFLLDRIKAKTER